MKAVTASEALDICGEGSLTYIVPGSWINSNFDVWIGSEEDNRAWELLGGARDFFERNKDREIRRPANRELALQEVWIGEGSDWCWWYGPEHSSRYDEEFDLLYRKHLSNIYLLLDESPPDNLAVPIKRVEQRVVNYAPTGLIDATIDGRETNYFEWIGSGLYLPDVSSGSMHGVCNYLDALYYGCGRSAVYLRLDFAPAFTREKSSFEVRIAIDGDCNARIHASASEGKIRRIEFWKDDQPRQVPVTTGDSVQAAFAQIFEARVDFALLGVSPGKQIQVQVSLWANNLPLQLLPKESWLTMDLSGELQSW